ncbi:probable aminotransferase TAT2 isoform X3 [Arachis hypogaea]|uniref:probable aminotransferase TAT2 isoform X3 n=1 Tax=Arachis hypogaea TaxID=3818 RepID=UPI003B22451F
MENGGNGVNYESKETSTMTIKGILSLLMQSTVENKNKRVISLGLGDPTLFSCFQTTSVSEEAVADTLFSHKFHGYAPTAGLPQTRQKIAEYLSRDLPYELSSHDVFITCGCTQAIDVSVAILARGGANILLPRPGFPIYELCAAFRQVEVRHYDLLLEKGWEVDLDSVKALADHNTVALVVINPGNPCGNVYSYNHLEKVVERITKYFDLLGGPATFIQAAVPRILNQTEESFFKKTIDDLRLNSDICFKEIEEIPCMFCPHKPEGSMTMIVKLNLLLLEDITDDIDFCFKLAKEESVIILPGTAVGLKDWLRITFAADPSALVEGLKRVKVFCQRHAKNG